MEVKANWGQACNAEESTLGTRQKSIRGVRHQGGQFVGSDTSIERDTIKKYGGYAERPSDGLTAT